MGDGNQMHEARSEGKQQADKKKRPRDAAAASTGLAEVRTRDESFEDESRQERGQLHSLPRPCEGRHDIKAAVHNIWASGADSDTLRLRFNRGAKHGVCEGMTGKLLRNGTPYGSFHITAVEHRTSEATVDEQIPADQVAEFVIINPSR